MRESAVSGIHFALQKVDRIGRPQRRGRTRGPRRSEGAGRGGEQVSDVALEAGVGPRSLTANALYQRLWDSARFENPPMRGNRNVFNPCERSPSGGGTWVSDLGFPIGKGTRGLPAGY